MQENSNSMYNDMAPIELKNILVYKPKSPFIYNTEVKNPETLTDKEKNELIIELYKKHYAVSKEAEQLRGQNTKYYYALQHHNKNSRGGRI